MDCKFAVGMDTGDPDKGYGRFTSSGTGSLLWIMKQRTAGRLKMQQLLMPLIVASEGVNGKYR